MPFEFRKISDVGTSHPVVARLAVQTAEVLKWLNVDKGNSRRDLIDTLCRAADAASLCCHKIRDDISLTSSTRV